MCSAARNPRTQENPKLPRSLHWWIPIHGSTRLQNQTPDSPLAQLAPRGHVGSGGRAIPHAHTGSDAARRRTMSYELSIPNKTGRETEERPRVPGSHRRVPRFDTGRGLPTRGTDRRRRPRGGARRPRGRGFGRRRREAASGAAAAEEGERGGGGGARRAGAGRVWGMVWRLRFRVAKRRGRWGRW
ncbi:hypothetical protein BS78_04G162600 [Paspalum vaginatum]|nr:hypothetical protein BS78_04G162600 [Paspalum vaginatum]